MCKRTRFAIRIVEAIVLGGARPAEASSKNLDIERLRAFAALFVVVAHINWLNGIVHTWTQIGFTPVSGVDLFFVVSGFVVANAFERDIRKYLLPQESLAAFYTKRACRILPTAFVCLAAWLVAVYAFNRSGAFGQHTEDRGWVLGIVLYNVFFVANFAPRAIPNPLGWFWSLCVEEHFYLIYPCFRLLNPDRLKRVKILVAVVLVVALVFRMFFSSNVDVLHFQSQMRFDQIALGVLLAIGLNHFADVVDAFARAVRESWRLRLAVRTVLVLALLMIAFVPTSPRPLYNDPPVQMDTELFVMRVGLIVTGVLSTVVVGLAALDLQLLGFGSAAVGKVLAVIGSRSYSIYMYHVPAQWVVQEFRFRHPGLFGATVYPNLQVLVYYFAVLIVLVELNYHVIEQPMIRRGRALLSRRAAPRAAEALSPDLQRQVIDRIDAGGVPSL